MASEPSEPISGEGTSPDAATQSSEDQAGYERVHENRAGSPEEIAIEYCEGEIEYYHGVFAYNHRWWKRLQSATIVFGGIGALTGAATFPKPHWLDGIPLGWLKGVPAAVATMAAGLLGSFNYQTDAVRHGSTADSLQGELVKFRARAKPYENRQNATSLFLDRVREIIQAEQGEWRMQTTKKQSSASGSPGGAG
jgi:hypothetical protein